MTVPVDLEPMATQLVGGMPGAVLPITELCRTGRPWALSLLKWFGLSGEAVFQLWEFIAQRDPASMAALLRAVEVTIADPALLRLAAGEPISEEEPLSEERRKAVKSAVLLGTSARPPGRPATSVRCHWPPPIAQALATAGIEAFAWTPAEAFMDNLRVRGDALSRTNFMVERRWMEGGQPQSARRAYAVDNNVWGDKTRYQIKVREGLREAVRALGSDVEIPEP